MKKTITIIALAATVCAFTLGSCASKKQGYVPAPMPTEVVVSK